MSPSPRDPEQPHEDLRLVQRALSGEVAAVDTLIQRMGCVYRILAHRNARLGEPFGQSELEDLAQEVTMAVWRKLGLYEGRASLRVWVYHFVHLETIYRLRKKDRRPALLGDIDPGLEAGIANPEGAVPESFEDLQPALAQLESSQADVIRLKHFEGLTFPEIGARLGAATNTAKTRYYRGLKRLREILLRGRTPTSSGSVEGSR